MATKRPAPTVHPSRHDQVPSEPSRKRRKPNVKAGHGAKSFKKAHPVNELKSRIRSLKRQLERDDSLSAVAQQEKERALQAAKNELEKNQRAKQRNDMIGKWHKVRFFDRRKAEKRLKRARKELDGLQDGDETRLVLEEKVAEAEVDVKYAIFYPLEKEYVPLFPRRKKVEGEDEGSEDGVVEAERKGDPVTWQKVRRCMEEGTLDALRNGKLSEEKGDDGGSDLKPIPTKRQKRKPDAREREDGAESESERDEGGTSFWE